MTTELRNRYQLAAELGRGAMGTVFRAYDTILQRDVAVKLVNNVGLGTEGRARLLREARAAARLNHPNIIAIYDAGETDDQPFIVMELLTGQTLRQYQTHSLTETIDLAKQICAALEHAHASGIIHRDLKLENVMIAAESEPNSPDSRSPRVKLMDFGLAFANNASRLTQEGALVGTISYLAPETIEGQPASAASDLYALGVMLYELTAQRAPFEGETLMAILSQHLYAPIVPPSTYKPDLPATFDALIVQLLAKRPQDRPTSAAEVRRQLIAIQQPTKTVALPDLDELPLLDRIVRGRLVAREREMTEALRLWRRAIRGEGGVLLISGEPGIGKTRLARELMAQARFRGAQVLLGECYAEGGAPYAPLTQVVQAALEFNKPAGSAEQPRFLTTTVTADLLTIAPSLRDAYPDVPLNPPLEPQAEQQRIFDSVVSFFTAMSARSAVLLVIDDAHWADSATLALLRQVARRSRQLRLLMVLTYREIELDEARPFNTMLFDLNRERLTTRLKLTRLDRAQTGELLTTMFQSETSASFLDSIYRETEGNPFFVEEVCKALIEDGQLSRVDGHWQQPDPNTIEIPQNVKLAIQSRVSNLPEATQETLRRAAVLGREFDFDTLQAMSDLDEDTLIEALEKAQRAQLIDEVPHAKATSRLQFAFAHALIPASLHDGLSGMRRQRLHLRAAQAIERIRADRLEEWAAQLGWHYAQAGEREKAIEYLLQAGDRARRAYAYQDAIEHYRQALAFLKDRSGHLERAADTAMNLGWLYHSVMDFERARQAYDDAFDLWQHASEAAPTARLSPATQRLRCYRNDVQTLDPTQATDSGDKSIIEQFFSGLVEFSFDFGLTPMLARRWEILEGGRRYVFHLRPDARWNDGQPVTAHDFKCSWRRTLDPEIHSPNAEYLMAIKNAAAVQQGKVPLNSLGVQALDDLTLGVELEEPTGHFLQTLAVDATFAVPCHVVERFGAAWSEAGKIVTNGPFQLVEWQRGEKMIMERNPDYCGRFSGNVTRVELTLGTSEGSELLDKYDAGEYDIGVFSSADSIERARYVQRRASEYAFAPMANTQGLGFDAARPPFDNMQVRQAFAHAIDRKTLGEVILRDTVTPALGGFVPLGMLGHSPDIGLAYDPDRARHLLAEAGYPAGRNFPAIEVWLAAGRDTRRIGTYLQTQWRETLGLEVAWQQLDWNVYRERLTAHVPHIFSLGWIADYPDPDSFLRVALHHPMYHHWHDAQYEQLLTKARGITDPTDRLKFYQAADRMLMQTVGMLPLFYSRRHWLVKPWVKRYPVSVSSASYWKDVIIEPH
jgi:ABC-type oligopeptide transport system substrate-binding subunit/type II secretory pathway predicted ATPase ExeA